ncbi:MAG: hypothetical protein M1269_00630 [Chloroflexi bacterium]|nr:hypothetical protein [Chloroflexota bacterium]
MRRKSFDFIGKFLIFFILLLTLFGAAAQAEDYLIFVNNREFLGDIFFKGDVVFLECQWLPHVFKDQDLKIDNYACELLLDGKNIKCIKGGGGKLFVSGQALASSFGGKYKNNRETKTVDIYTFGEKKRAIKASAFRLNMGPESAKIDIVATSSPLPPTASRVVYTMKNLGISVEEYPLKVVFDDASKFSRGKDSQGYFQMGFSGKKLIKCEVHILNNLPEDAKTWAIAHELGHLWYFMNGCVYTDQYHSEGFAEWVGYKVCTTLGYGNEATMRTYNIVPVYGEGLRYYLDLESKYFQNGVLQYVRGNFKPPQ